MTALQIFARLFQFAVFLVAFATHAADITVAAAADLKFAFDEIVTEFQKAHTNVSVRVSYGSSGNFYSQLTQRAPFDLFLSADVNYPTRLIEAGYAVADSKFIYAVGKIVIWARTNSPVDPAKLGVESLRHPAVRKIAIANPEHAPYGKAAVAAMRKLGIYEEVKDRLVFGESISQTAQFIEGGAADMGVIALSLAVAPVLKSKGRAWEFPLDTYPRMDQAGVILSGSRNPIGARDLRTFLLSERGQNVLRRHGFLKPE